MHPIFGILALACTAAAVEGLVHKPAAAELAQAKYPVNLTEADVRNMEKSHDPFDSLPNGAARNFKIPLNQTDSSVQFTKRIRRNILHMTLDEQSEWFMACRLLKQEPHLPPFGANTSHDDGRKWNTWDWLAYKHQMVSSDFTQVANGDLFLPWHRMWLLYYEAQYQRITGNANMTQPYWDFSNRYEAMKIFTDPMFGGNGTGPTHQVKNGQFANWTQKVAQGSNEYTLASGRITRQIGVTNTRWNPWDGRGVYVSSFGRNISYTTKTGFGVSEVTPEQKQAGTLPSPCDYMLALNTQAAFSVGTLHAMCEPSASFGIWWLHRMAHKFIGGDLQTVSGNDPILLVLHTFTDKIWLMWQKAHVNGLKVDGQYIPVPDNATSNTYGFPDGAMNETLAWVGSTARDMIQWEDLDYVYEWDDTIDMIYYKYQEYNKGLRKKHMCQAFTQSIGLRNYSKAGCHLMS